MLLSITVYCVRSVIVRIDRLLCEFRAGDWVKSFRPIVCLVGAAPALAAILLGTPSQADSGWYGGGNWPQNGGCTMVGDPAVPVCPSPKAACDSHTGGIYVSTDSMYTTVAPDGQPSARMVLMKEYDQRGFVFEDPW